MSGSHLLTLPWHRRRLLPRQTAAVPPAIRRTREKGLAAVLSLPFPFHPVLSPCHLPSILHPGEHAGTPLLRLPPSAPPASFVLITCVLLDLTPSPPDQRTHWRSVSNASPHQLLVL